MEMIRELKMEDTEEIKKMVLAIFSEEPWNDVWTDEQLHLYVLELIGGSNSLAFGLYKDDLLVGISLGRVRHWCRGTEYWIDEFGILPEEQNRGLGTDFLQMIERALLERDITEIVLLTERTVYACNFYKMNGFEEKEEQVFMAKSLG